MPQQYDVIIIGGGVVGCLVARELARYHLSILLIEKESDIGSWTSAANTALIHPGYDPVPGSLKAQLNVAGNPLWDNLAEELQFAFERSGDYVVAVGKEELPALERLLEQGRKNGVPGLEIISGEAMLKREPLLNPLVSGALWAPTGGICDPFGVTVAAAENAVQNGVELLTDTAFNGFLIENHTIRGVQTTRGDFSCRWAVNAAGLFSDEVMHAAGVRPEFSITPRRGEYYILDRADVKIDSVYFPVPTEVSKGILVTTTVHGNTIVGPTANDIEDKNDRANTPQGMQELFDGGKKLVPCIEARHIIAVFAGLRAAGNAACQTPGVNYNNDFIVEIPSEVRGFVNLGGIESPGLTSAPAIAKRVGELIKEAGEPLRERADFNPIRPARPVFRHLNTDERQALIAQDERYGRVVCRCENVTEGEIVAEIHAPVPARTYDALKRRTWLGTGRCQGGFDLPRVTAILARELGTSELEISKKGSGSEFLSRPTKDVEENHA